MSIINSVFNAIFDGFFAITGFLGGEAALWIFSAIAGVVFLLIFKYTSDQKAIKRTKDRISAGFLAVRLYKDDFKQVWKANGSIFMNAFRYMGNALRPLLFIIVPGLLMLIQLNCWYGYQPLEADLDYRVLTPLMDETGMTRTNPILAETSTVLTAKVAENIDLRTAEISIDTGEGLKQVTPVVRVPEKREISWRLQALKNGEYPVTVTVDGDSVSHTVFIGNDSRFRKMSAVTTGDQWNQLWHPANPPVAGDSAVQEVSVHYAEAKFKLLGWLEMHWVIAFFLLSLIFGFALKGVFGVEI